MSMSNTEKHVKDIRRNTRRVRCGSDCNGRVDEFVSYFLVYGWWLAQVA